MVTSFLNHADVAGYIFDLAKRLEQLDPKPSVVCILARSGTALRPFLLRHPVIDGA
jgi:hypothetical protein